MGITKELIICFLYIDCNSALAPGQLWIKGGEKAETKGYFSLMNFNSSKELVAISSSFLTMKGKPINECAVYPSRVLLLYHISFLSLEIGGNLPNSIFDDTTSCLGEVQHRDFFARYLTWFFLALLLLLEVFQFLSNVLTGNWREYFSKQNFCELAMLSLTIAFLVIEWQVKNPEIEDQLENALGKSSYQEVLLGKPFQHWRL